MAKPNPLASLWIRRWRAIFPNEDWEQLEAALAKLSADASPRKHFKLIHRWLDAHPELSAKIDRAVGDTRSAVRAFDMGHKNEGKFSRKSMREKSQ